MIEMLRGMRMACPGLILAWQCINRRDTSAMIHSTSQQGTDPIASARAAYRAVLAPWAQDLLMLRHRGLDRPSVRYIQGLVLVRPSKAAGHADAYETTSTRRAA